MIKLLFKLVMGICIELNGGGELVNDGGEYKIFIFVY